MKTKNVGKVNFKSSRFKNIVFTLILTVSLLFNAMYFFGIIEYKIKTKKKIEFIDSPIHIHKPIDIETKKEIEDFYTYVSSIVSTAILA